MKTLPLAPSGYAVFAVARKFFILALVILLSVAVARGEDPATKQEQDPVPTAKPVKKILFFYKSAEYVDPVVCRTAGEPTVARLVLGDLGKRNHIQFTFSADGSIFTAENIRQYDAFCFFTSGNLTEKGADQNPPMSAGGKGFVGIHSAADTFASGGTKVDPYIQMLGGELLVRVRGLEPAHQIVADEKFPGLASIPPDYGPTEEWYAMRNYAANLHVLLIMDTATMVRGAYYAPNYPSTWARLYGKGRVFYTNLGHEKGTWNSMVFQNILAGGLNWAAGAVDADISPNIEQVTPHLRMQ